MNDREVAELRRRFRPDYSNITTLRGCYVNDRKEILTDFTTSVALMTEDEKEKVLNILKKALSGSLGKNLLEIEFPTRQVMEGGEHRLLRDLKDSRLADDAACKKLFDAIISTVTMDCNYLILLAYDAYDVPHRSKDGEFADSDQVFSYIVCAVCPVRLSKSGLSFHAQDREFRNARTDWIVSAPELGFLFPAFDHRAANLYGALTYTRDPADNREEFIRTVFGAPAPMAATQQQQTFRAVLGASLEEDCSMEVVRSVHAQLSDMIDEHKKSREREPLMVSKPEIQYVLKAGGVSEEKVEAFSKRFDEYFGEQTDLRPKNLIETGRFRVNTPDVKIQVAPDKADLVQTKVIGGIKYILIRAEEGVEVNGVDIEIL